MKIQIEHNGVMGMYELIEKENGDKYALIDGEEVLIYYVVAGDTNDMPPPLPCCEVDVNV